MSLSRFRWAENIISERAYEFIAFDDTLRDMNLENYPQFLDSFIAKKRVEPQVTLLHEMKRSSKKEGLATLCVGGGMGVALQVRR